MKQLLPGTVLKLKNTHPQQWIAAVHEHLLSSVQSMPIIDAKKKFLSTDTQRKDSLQPTVIFVGLIQTWPLFGTTSFSIQVCYQFSKTTVLFCSVVRSGSLPPITLFTRC